MVVSLIVGALASTAAVGGSAVAKASVATGLVGLSCGAVGKGAFGGFIPATTACAGASVFGHGAFASAYASVPAWGFGHGAFGCVPCAPHFAFPPPFFHP